MKRRRSRLRRRYGCFRLPERKPPCGPEGCVYGAKKVKKGHSGVSWLARTDPKAKQVEFGEQFDALSPEGKRYIILHERAHLKTGPDHNPRFFEELKKLADANDVDWRTAWELESWNCHKKN